MSRVGPLSSSCQTHNAMQTVFVFYEPAQHCNTYKVFKAKFPHLPLDLLTFALHQPASLFAPGPAQPPIDTRHKSGTRWHLRHQMANAATKQLWQWLPDVLASRTRSKPAGGPGITAGDVSFFLSGITAGIGGPAFCHSAARVGCLAAPSRSSSVV